MSPLVSIIMPAYNAAKYIQESIDSVYGQTWTDWELIIINDGSTDDTASIVKMNQLKCEKIILIEQENKKQAAARNSGLKIARGTWIAFLDADDVWAKNKLEVQLGFQNKADVLFTSGTILYESKNKKELYKTEYGFFPSADMYAKLYTYNPIPNLAVLMKREWIDKIGYQNESLDVVGCEDWEYWIRLAKNGATFFGIEDQLFIYRIQSQGTSRNLNRMRIAQAYAKYINLDFSLLNKEHVQAYFKNLMQPLINRLLESNQKKEALKQIRILNEVTEESNYNLIQFLLNTGISINSKFLIYLAKPMLALRALKRAFMQIK
ncbi:glycosyltransferase [Chryseolinea sp. H1M3-3]|uniref:glycosyltransferase family 2 protein n=1 Tax=Chryseolinea sp. H1M3-3 TaxID=3034144 RepID=UPI0023ECE8E0|nr:glycosyltransferase [Chryseolinea sp. H1M3-3]